MWQLSEFLVIASAITGQLPTRDTATMARLRSLLQHICSLMLLLAVGSEALKFEIQAGSGHDKASRRCIRNFVSKDMLVVVTAIVDGHKGDGMQLNMHVRT